MLKKNINELSLAQVNKVINGDCIQEMKTLPDNSIDLVFKRNR